MLKLKNKLGPAGVVTLAIIFAGCLFSATFVINKTFTLTDAGGFYSYRVDLSSNSTWKEHKDEIDMIEMVGFVLYITSTEPSDVAFSAYMDKAAGAAPDPSSVPTTATVVIDGLNVTPGKQVISYAQSLKVIRNLDVMKTLVKSGLFDFYAESTGDTGNTFKVDSVTVVITFSAG